MEKNIFMVFDNYLDLLARLKAESDLEIFMSSAHEEPFVLVDDAASLMEVREKFPMIKVIMGAKSDFKFGGRPQSLVTRNDKVGFVRALYGGDDEEAIGMSIFDGDKSETEQKIGRALTKILKEKAHKGVVDAQGKGDYITERYYWTDEALMSGKNWHMFLGTGVRKPLNGSPGYRPK